MVGRSRVAVVVLAGVGLVACAGILGIDDRSLDPQADGGGGGDGSGSGSGGDGGSGGGDGGGGPGCATDPCLMADKLNHPFAMTADDANVYWTEYGSTSDTNGSVKSCPVAGCGAGPVVYAQLQAAPRGIAIDAQNVYWGTEASSATPGAIWSCPLAGCSGKPTKVASADNPFGLTVDATSVFWTEFFDGTVNRAPKAGGAAQLLWDGGSGNGGGINGPEAVAVDTSFVYVNDQNAAAYRVPIGGGNLVPMYTDTNNTPVGVFGLGVDPKNLFIGDLGGIFQMGKSATSGATALVPNLTDVVDLKVDRSGVLYWADFGSSGRDGTVGKVPLDGGAPVLLHQSLVTPEAVAVNSTRVFWLSNGDQLPDGTTVDSTGKLLSTPK